MNSGHTNSGAAHVGAEVVSPLAELRALLGESNQVSARQVAVSSAEGCRSSF